jgi:hypothetical protein
MSGEYALEKDLNGIGKKVANMEVEFKRCEARKGAQLEAYKESTLELKNNVQEIYGLFREMSDRVHNIEISIEKLVSKVGTAAWGIGMIIALAQVAMATILYLIQ